MPVFRLFNIPHAATKPLILLCLKVGLLLGGGTVASAESVMLAWNPNPETNITGYEVHYGTSSDQLSTVKVVASATTTLDGLESATTYYCAVLAYDGNGLKSPLSAQVSFNTRAAPVLLVRNSTGSPMDSGRIMDLGLVNLGAMSETMAYTVTNVGATTVNGIKLALLGKNVGSFDISGAFPINRQVEINGSFESLLATWTVAGSVAASTIPGATDGKWAKVFSAGNKANNGVLSRTFPTTPGTSYSLSFDVGVLAFNNKEQRLQTRVSGAETLLTDTAILNGTSSGDTIWSPRNLAFVADSNTTTLTFADVSNNTIAIDLVLDNVRVVEQGPASGATVSSLAPGKSASFSISFRPGSAGNHDAVLNLTADPEYTVFFAMNLRAGCNMFFEQWLTNNGVAADNPEHNAPKNLFGFAFGTDPGAAHGKASEESGGNVISRGSPAPRIVTSPSFEFRGQFCRRKNHETAGLIYRPQFSADLKTWVDATATPVMHADDGEIEIVSVASPADIGGQAPRFFRVGLDQQRPVALPGWLVRNGAGGGTNGNPDGDALDNFFEFAFGTNPAVAQAKSASEVNGLLASRGVPAVRVHGNQGAPGFEFSGLFCRRKDRALHGLIYKPQFSADLVTWVDATESPEVRADDGEIEVVSVSAPDSLDGKTPRFFRVGLSQYSPPPSEGMAQMIETVTEDPNGNPDGDGLNNVLEFAFGTNPAIAQSSQIAESGGWLISRGAPAARVTSDPDFEFKGLFGRRMDRSTHGLIYKPQFSADLATWMDADDPPAVLTDDGEIEVVSVRAPAHIDGMTPRFFRVAVSRTP